MGDLQDPTGLEVRKRVNVPYKSGHMNCGDIHLHRPEN